MTYTPILTFYIGEKIGLTFRLFREETTPLTLVIDNKPTAEKNILLPKVDITTSVIVEPEASVGAIWRNPYPQGTPEARQASLEVVIEAMLYGLPPVDDDQTQKINDMARDVLSGMAKLADFRRLLGLLH